VSVPPCGAGAPLFSQFPLCPFNYSAFALFCFSLSYIGFTYFLSIPSFSTRIVPLRFQAGGRRKRPNLGLVCCVCVIVEFTSLSYFPRMPCVGPGHPPFPPLSPCPFTLSSFGFFTFPFLSWLYLFSSFVHPFPFYQNSPTLFPGRRS